MTTRSIIQIDIIEMTYQGYALGRDAGRPVFVRYALPGERVQAEVERDKGSYATATARDIEQAAPERVPPPCPYFGPDRCGGCQWQHAGYEAQLRYKTAIVAEQFTRIGRLPDVPIGDTLPSPDPYNYRTHATFTVNRQGQLAFVGADERTLQPIDHCLLLRPSLNDLLYRLDTVDFTGAERVRLQAGSQDDDLAVVVYGRLRDPSPLMQVADGASVVEAHGKRTRTLKGTPPLSYTIGGHSFRSTAGGFFQVNLAQAEILVAIVSSLLPPQRIGHALDLYSGAGLFSAFLAPRCDWLTCIEQYGPAVEDARHNLAAFDHVTLIEDAVEQALMRIEAPVDVVVADPPRAGMKPAVIEQLTQLRPSRIVYVSCDPTTLARDARALVTSGYRLDSVQPVDMFPQTYHIECVACFSLGAAFS